LGFTEEPGKSPERVRCSIDFPGPNPITATALVVGYMSFTNALDYGTFDVFIEFQRTRGI
jgi:hypothetical protein